ncbi:MAG: SCP2 sterol-binding domain-containing protein [Acidimicrobiales bacterium]|nr:SCP2 sterol-binding domain-containing protein [Acidimicrobiales bacterium]
MARARASRPAVDIGRADAFFDQLREKEYEPLLHDATGGLRVDLRTGERAASWRLDVDHGHVSVSRRQGRADAALRAERALFDRFVEGEANMMAALLRGAIDVEGDLGLLTAFGRLFPGPPSSQRSPGADGKASTRKGRSG